MPGNDLVQNPPPKHLLKTLVPLSAHKHFLPRARVSAPQPDVRLHLFTARSCWKKANTNARTRRGCFLPPVGPLIRLTGGRWVTVNPPEAGPSLGSSDCCSHRGGGRRSRVLPGPAGANAPTACGPESRPGQSVSQALPRQERACEDEPAGGAGLCTRPRRTASPHLAPRWPHALDKAGSHGIPESRCREQRPASETSGGASARGLRGPRGSHSWLVTARPQDPRFMALDETRVLRRCCGRARGSQPQGQGPR